MIYLENKPTLEVLDFRGTMYLFNRQRVFDCYPTGDRAYHALLRPLQGTLTTMWDLPARQLLRKKEWGL